MIQYRDFLRRIHDGDFDHVSEEDKKRAIDQLVATCSLAAAATTLQPIPLVDLALIMAIQLAMVQGIARIRGCHLDKKSVYEIYRTLRTSFLTHQAVILTAKLVPIYGWAVAASAAYALTFAFGEVADRYFKGGRKLAPSEVKRLFKRAYKKKRQEKCAKLRKDRNLSRELAELERARRRGECSDEQVAKKREELLARADAPDEPPESGATPMRTAPRVASTSPRVASTSPRVASTSPRPEEGAESSDPSSRQEHRSD